MKDRRTTALLKKMRSVPVSAACGMAILCLYACVALFASAIAPYGEFEVVSELSFAPANGEFLLGTDQLGRDILSRLIFGAQNSLLIAVIATALSCLIGSFFGLSAALIGGLSDQILSRLVDAIMSVPDLIFILVVLAIYGNSTVLLIVIIGVITSTKFFRVSRAAALNVISLDYVDAAKARGEKTTWIVFNEILPGALPLILSEAGMRFSFVFLSIAALSFLGVGIQAPLAEWGSMVRENAVLLNSGRLTPLIPAAAISLLTVAVNLVVDWLLDRASGLSQ